jgi:pimeloyl-ACP methyl ester carboxylesterase
MSDGVRIYYERIGQGPPVVLHHGSTQTLKRWHMCGYVEALRGRFDLILIDPRGHGGSDKPYDRDAYTLEQRVADVIRVIDEAGVPRVTFWGYSDGGRVGFGLAKYAQHRLDGLIIGGHPPCAYQAPEHLRLNPNDDPEVFVAKLRQVVAGSGPIPPERLQEWLANDFRALAAAIHDEPSLEDVLPQITVPCLLYAGERDMFFAEIKGCVPCIRKASFFSIPNMGHPAGFWQSQTVIPRATAFLDSIYRPAPDLQTCS